ncbi:uncharacterized protein [Littorina saxatilis]
MIGPQFVPVMDVYSNSVQQLYFLGVLGAFGSVLTQTEVHLVCPSEVWEPEATITLKCFVKIVSYPSKCVTFDGKQVIFRQSFNGVTFVPKCNLTDTRATCRGGSNCFCGKGNISHFLFEYTFKATKYKEGYWDCSVPCWNGSVALTSQQSDCDNRKVYENPDRLKKELTDLKKKYADLYGSVLTQRDIHIVCPPELWKPGDTIVIQCFVQKSSYPAKCVTLDGKKVTFGKSDSRYVSYTPVCTLTDITGNCDSTGDCRCVPGNSSHFLFEYEFTAATNTEGYYDCSVRCFDGALTLTFQNSGCDNRKVFALEPCPTPADSSLANTLAISLGVGVVGAVCVVMAAFSAGVTIGKRKSGSHQNAPPKNAHPNNAPPNKAHPNNALQDNAPQDNAPPDNAPPNNAAPDNAPLANSPPFNSPAFNSTAFNSPLDNGPQVAGQAGPSTGFASSPEAELDEPSADASDASELSELGSESEFTASGVGEV